jgi:hypothetical protein
MRDTADLGACDPGNPKQAVPWQGAEPAPEEAAPVAGRTLGLAALAVAVAAIGVVMLLWAGAWLSASDIVAGSGLAAVARVIVPALVVLAVAEFVLAYGVWELRPWAWRLGVVLTIAALVLTVFSAGRSTDGVQTLSLLLEIGTLWYLLSEGVHARFQAGRR